MSALGSDPKSKVVIITGGASGIGLAAVNLFLDAGAFVAAVDISEKALSELPSNPNLLPVRCDITQLPQVEAAVQTVIEKWSRLDVLVNNAGIVDNFAGIHGTTDDAWDRCVAINLTGVKNFMRTAFPHLTGNPDKVASIVNVASIAAARGGMAGAAYTASKHAVVGLTKSTAFQYGKGGPDTGRISCNCVSPGATMTNLKNNSPMPDPEGIAACAPYHALMPMPLDPKDIGRAILFLATNHCINGADLIVDQGWSV